MSTRAPAPRAPARATRRSQAERTAETRAAIMRAVVESIADVGFQRTTAAEIARRAGVTWGAVQHHFGGKDGILRAVLEDSFERFAARLADVPPEGLPLAERVSLFVDRSWAHFRSAHYRSTFEILLHSGGASGADGADPERGWQGEMFRAWNRVWRRLFHEARLSRRRTAALQQYTIGALAGLASLEMLEGPAASGASRSAELALLKDTLRRELDAAG